MSRKSARNTIQLPTGCNVIEDGDYKFLPVSFLPNKEGRISLSYLHQTKDFNGTIKKIKYANELILFRTLLTEAAANIDLILQYHGVRPDGNCYWYSVTKSLGLPAQCYIIIKKHLVEKALNLRAICEPNILIYSNDGIPEDNAHRLQDLCTALQDLWDISILSKFSLLRFLKTHPIKLYLIVYIADEDFAEFENKIKTLFGRDENENFSIGYNFLQVINIFTHLNNYYLSHLTLIYNITLQRVAAYKNSASDGERIKIRKEVVGFLNEIVSYGKWNAVDAVDGEDERILANVIIKTLNDLGNSCQERDIARCIDDKLNSAIRHQVAKPAKAFKLFSEVR